MLRISWMSCIRLSIGCTCKVGTCSGAVDVEWRWCLLTRLHDVDGGDGTDRAPCQENEHMSHSPSSSSSLIGSPFVCGLTPFCLQQQHFTLFLGHPAPPPRHFLGRSGVHGQQDLDVAVCFGCDME